MAIDARGDAVCYTLQVTFPAEPSRGFSLSSRLGSRMVGRVGLGGTFIAVAVAITTLAVGITGARLSAALAARSDVPLNVDTASDGTRYRLLGSVVANQPLTNDLDAEVDAQTDEERPSLFSDSAFNAGAFAPDDRSLFDAISLLAAAPFAQRWPDYDRTGRFVPDHFQQAAALADITPLPRRRPRLASLAPFESIGVAPEDNFIKTAIYDISSRVVYMPNGERLEAHSGLGPKMDDPRHVHIRMHGATPPNTYRLTMREKPFHGVEAIRMTPAGGGEMFGRAGILVHPYMLGPNGQSNGCMSLKDYPKFLAAFKRGEVERVAVVAKLDKPPAFARAVEPENKFASLLKLFGVE